MRIVLQYLDQLRIVTLKTLPQFADRIVTTFEELVEAITTWQEQDHHADGTHDVIHINEQSAAAAARSGAITLYWNGTNLKYVKPDGSTGNVV